MTRYVRGRRPSEHERARAGASSTEPPVGGLTKLQAAGNRAMSGLLQRQKDYHLLEEGLTLDPEIELELRRRGLVGQPAEKPVNLWDPKVIEKAAEGRAKPEWTPLPEHAPKPAEPIVPQGEGPKEARKGSVGDVWDAVKKIPMVDKGLDKLQDEAKRRWRKARGK